jgi:hypothetical protein
MDPQFRLDQGESAAFLRQLEDIDTQAYMARFPQFLSRQIIKTFVSVAEWAALYTWREWTPEGSAKVITDHADDLPSVDVTGKEFSQPIKDFGNSYGYTIKEIKQSVATNTPLDALRAQASRRGMEQLIDDLLAVGNSDLGINGILKLDSTAIAAANRVGVTTLATKAAGGTAWGTLLAPKATGQEVANDIIGLCAARVTATKGVWTEFDVVVPIDQYNYASATRLNPITTATALDFALSSKFVRSVTPWFKAAGAGGSGADRMMALPAGDAMVLGGIVPMEWSPQGAQLRNMKYVINAIASCGGVVCRYPVALQYADGL